MRCILKRFEFFWLQNLKTILRLTSGEDLHQQTLAMLSCTQWTVTAVMKKWVMQLLTPWVVNCWYTENEKQPNSSTISFPPGAKPFPKQQLARWVGPYLRRAAGGEALIGDWGGWRLSGWWASLIAVLLEGRGLASTKRHAGHTQIWRDVREHQPRICSLCFMCIGGKYYQLPPDKLWDNSVAASGKHDCRIVTST